MSRRKGRHRHRRPHDASCGVCHQPTETEADRASLRVDENRGWLAEAAASRRRARRLDRDLYRGRVQPDPSAHTPGEGDMTGTLDRLGRMIANPPERSAHRPSSVQKERDNAVTGHFFIGLLGLAGAHLLKTAVEVAQPRTVCARYLHQLASSQDNSIHRRTGDTRVISARQPEKTATVECVPPVPSIVSQPAYPASTQCGVVPVTHARQQRQIGSSPQEQGLRRRWHIAGDVVRGRRSRQASQGSLVLRKRQSQYRHQAFNERITSIPPGVSVSRRQPPIAGGL